VERVEGKQAGRITEARSAAYLAAALDCVVMADQSGRIVEFNPAAEQTFGYTREQTLGRTLAELIVPPSLRQRHSEAFARFAATGEGRLLGRRMQLTGMRADGSEFPVELALSRVEGDPVLVCGALRDLTDAKRAEEDLRRHAAEHAALRRVATLVALGAPPAEVFAAVAEGVAELLDVPAISMVRFEGDGTASKVAGWGKSPFPVGTRWALTDPSVMALVAQTGRPARIEDYGTVSGRQAGRIRAGGIRSALGVPLTVDGAGWGAVIAFATGSHQFADDAEERLARFTELVATAIANSEARDGLRRLADEQTALRRVATLIAREVPPAEVFAAVAREVAVTLDVPLTAVVRFQADGIATQVGAWGGENPFPVGTTWTLDEHSVSGQVARTREPARVDDYSTVPGEIASRLSREAGIHTAVGVPILVGDSPWGVMMALSTAERPLREDIETRLGAFTELIATAIANTQARHDLRRLADAQAALRRVATLVAEGAPASKVFSAVAREVAEVSGLPLVELGRFDADGWLTVIGSAGDHPLQTGTRWPMDNPAGSATIRATRRATRIEYTDDLPGTVAEAIRSIGVRWAVGVPIVVNGKAWGSIGASAADGGPPPPDAEAGLFDFSELVSTAISNAQARDELDVFAREQEALRRVATITAAGASPRQVFDAVCEEAGRLIGATSVNLACFTADGFSEAIAAWGLRETYVPTGVRFPLQECAIDLLVQDRRAPARVDTYAGVPGKGAEEIRRRGIYSEVGAPVVMEGRVWGAIVAGWDTPQPPPEGAEFRLAGFAELVATAIANQQARDDLRRLADEQAALRRVATLVARGSESRGVFDSVCEETGRLLGATSVNLAYFTPDRFNLTMAGWSLHDTHVPTGTRLPLEGDTINAIVQRTGAPARCDSYDGVAGELAALIRRRGIVSEVGAPVIVDGRVWGILVAGWETSELSPPGTESRLARFAELVATAVSNAATRSELLASRARIVAATDETRRRMERDLHDGTQQRLISVGLDLQALKSLLLSVSNEAHAELDRLQDELTTILDEVREISRGLHPPLLSRAGLGPALKSLARRSPVPVELQVALDSRPVQSVEIAAYYVVSEAMANTVKHAHASVLDVRVWQVDDGLRLRVQDDGVGGADMGTGTGLIGLVDRVEALGGRFALESPPGRGTEILVELPMQLRTGGAARGV
jgi:PAS domain S-box-containing protein